MSGTSSKNIPVVISEILDSPVAGGNFEFICPSGVSREVLSLRFTFSTSIIPANRIVSLIARRAGSIILPATASLQLTPQIASLTLDYYFGLSPTNSALEPTLVCQPLPAGLILTPNDTLNTLIVNIDVGDAISDVIGTFLERNY
jgi:hypothetical protein